MRCKFFFEALGNPKDFVQNFLNKLLDDIKNFQGLKVLEHKIEEPIEREVEHNGKKIKLWSSFLEIEAELKDFPTLLDFVLMFSPSHIEVLDTKQLILSQEEINNMLNTISARVIQLSMIINDLRVQNQLLLKNLEKVAPRLAQAFKPNFEFKVKS